MSSAHVDQVAAVFDRWADAGRAEGMERGHGPTARPAFDRLQVGLGSRYLDVGCGNGYTVRWALARGAQAIGIDASPRMIERARAQTEGEATYAVARFPEHDLDLLAEGSLDAVFSMEVFYYLPDVDAAVAEVARLLAPGGHFACIVDFYAENEASHGWPDDLGVSMHLLSEAQWARSFETAGLAVVEQTRLREATPEDPAWKREQGSLLTLGRRP
ncbi:MAG: class I SAM-dependent methyltransferase [Nannocystaceae bacterium]|nr:class I SAM-dependent methyltransferase [bacterium]